mmetsp:Transcript_36574/g.108693  ORF Transcript_36574/g.108693 Transcript_36574/m.108693 type:complete len:378 (-) Transcript_36574:165-1298(-)
MPIYEEKLLCPLAVRFTQDHVRPVFQDGHDLESTIAAIKTKPGTGEYDLVLEAPFPAIEIVRWYQRHPSGSEKDGKHWCTLDNRRLYCLQRAAVAHWPKRVAVVVEVLYAATEGVLRKNDSSSAGLSVSIGHSPKALTDHWEWRSAAAAASGNDDAATVRAAEDLVAGDDVRSSVAELTDAPAGPSMLDRFFLAEEEAKKQVSVSEGSSCSTALSPSPRSASLRSISGNSSGSESPKQTKGSESWGSWSWCEGLEGNWRGEQGETYQVWATGETSWSCVKKEAGGRPQTFTLWYDEAGDSVWWGNRWTLYMKADEARNGGKVGWYAANGGRKPRFSWYKTDAPASAARQGAKGQAGARSGRAQHAQAAGHQRGGYRG